MTQVPSISVSDNPSTSPSTSIQPTVAPKLVYFPAKFDTLIYCMHGDVSDPHVLSTMPPANDEIYTTMCECCLAKVQYECHGNFKDECPTTSTTTTKPTTSVTSRPTTHRPTKKGETTIPTVSPVTSPATLPQLWLYYPVILDNTMWCVFGDHNDVSFLSLMPPATNETYTQLCDCCAQDHHTCHDVVEAECAPVPTTSSPMITSSPTIEVVDPTTPSPSEDTESPTYSPTEEVVTYSPTNVVVETNVPTTHNPTTVKPTTTKPTIKGSTSKPSSKRPTTSTPSTNRPTTSMPLVPFSSPITTPTSSKQPTTTMKPTSSKPTVTNAIIPVVHHCDMVGDVGEGGDAYWYPHDDERGCAMDANYTAGLYSNDALCHSFLFTNLDDCCLKFPDLCKEVSSESPVIKAMWYPEVFDSSSSSSNIKLLECIPGSDYPLYMTLPENANTHLFDTEDDCCIHIPCGTKLSKYWYPVADVTTQTVVCKFDNDYPIYMLVDSTEKKRLFTNETECVALWGAALHHCDADDGQGMAYWYPHYEDDMGCTLDADYPAELYTDNTLCMSFLFKTLDECCLKFPDSCLVPTVNITKMKWYPEMFISKSKIKMFHCISGSDYPAYMSLPENDDMYLFDSEEECCSVIPCGERLPKYWFPVADADTKTVVCRYDIDYPLYMMKSTDDTYLFSNEADCIATWEHTGLSVSASPSLYPSTSPTTASPSMLPTMHLSTFPSYMPTEETESPSFSPSESPSLSPSMEPTGEMDMYYYPRTTNKGKTYCAIGHKSALVGILVGMTKQDVNDYLSSTECECCTKHYCFVKPQGCTVSPTKSPVTAPISPLPMSPTNNPTSVTTVAITTAATPEHQFYPMQYGNWRTCITAKPYPINVTLYLDICQCCKEHGCTINLGDHCGETTSPVAAPTPPPVTITASPTSVATTTITSVATADHNYYFVQLAPGWKACIAAKPYPENVHFYPDICACCKKHECTINTSHCDETSAPVATPTPPAVTTTASPTVHQFYPVGGGNVITCISAHPYPDNVELFSDICQCCKKHGCTINLGDHCDETASEPTSTPPTSSNPTKLPSMHPTKLPSMHPTKLPSRHPTKTPSKVPTYKPTINTKAPSNHPITSVPTNKPTVNTSKDWYYPETYYGKQYCMHGTIANVPSIANMNPIDLYETLCDCCAKYICDAAHHDQCNKTKPTTSTPTTIITSQPPITSKPTSNDVIAPSPSPPPSSQWYFHPVHMGEHDWCAYDILTNNTYMQSLNPEELYTSMCDCCANHKCPDYVVTECAAIDD
jgi:hypothetical protein